MIKEFEIKDILIAVEKISKIDEKGKKISKKKINDNKKDILTLNKQVKSTKSEILVLDEMIE
tara:strand:- start:59 stop:244 length:186 start_codon:yes stop_codon:yes gene_type:complete